MEEEQIKVDLTNISKEDLWEEIYYRALKIDVNNRELEVSEEDLRSMAKNAHENNDDEEEDLYRRNAEMLDDLE